MKIAAIQASGGMNIPLTSNASQSTKSAGNTFGSVFKGMTSSSVNKIVTPQEKENVEDISEEAIQAIFGATTLDELKLAVKNTAEEITAMNNVKSLEELAEIVGLDPEKIIESLLLLLKKVGVEEDDLLAVSQTNDIWFVMDTIGKEAPQFFKGLTEALEGKAAIPKQLAVDLLTLLKAVQLVAPKTDLVMKQEQQVFSLQGFLTAAGESFERSLQTVKPNMLHLMENMRSSMHVANTSTSGNQHAISEEASIQGSDLNPSSLSSKESANQTTGGLAMTHVPQKAEMTLTELENRTNARNEALIREMQAIFKRSNFGQSGGTNRLSVKLYPEHLGQVRIELIQTNGVLTARILASTALGKEMLDSQLNQLRNAFVQQNVQVERIDIAQTLQDTSRNDREQAFNQQFKQQQQQNNDTNEQQDDQELTFQEYMIELEA